MIKGGGEVIDISCVVAACLTQPTLFKKMINTNSRVTSAPTLCRTPLRTFMQDRPPTLWGYVDEDTQEMKSL